MSSAEKFTKHAERLTAPILCLCFDFNEFTRKEEYLL